MDKKVTTILFLLLIVVAVTVTYVAVNQPSSIDEQSQAHADLTDEYISEEIEDYFLSEDDEIEIGEMI